MLTKPVQNGHVQENFTSDRLTENDRSRAKKVARSSFLDRIEAGNKLYPMQAASDPNLTFLGCSFFVKNWFKCKITWGQGGGRFQFQT